MAQSDIEFVVEHAIVGHLNQSASRMTGVTIRCGLEGDDRPLPCIVVSATGSEESIPMSGNYEVEVDVEIHSSANDTTKTDHRQRAAIVREEFNNTWIGASLSARESNFHVNGVVLGRATVERHDDVWQHTIPLRIWCRPS